MYVRTEREETVGQRRERERTTEPQNEVGKANDE